MSTANVRYIADDVDATIGFYTKHLGFDVEMRPAPGFVALRREDLRLLVNAPGVGGAGQTTSTGERPTPGGWNRIQIPVDDIQSWQARLRASGATFRGDIVQGKGGKQLLLEDPAGNLIELFEEANRSEVAPIPPGAQVVTPFLSMPDVSRFLDFVTQTFDGETQYAMQSADGTVRHARIRVGNSVIMVSSGVELFPPMPCMLHVYVANVDRVYAKALSLGASSLQPPAEQFYGDRSAGIEDAWGNRWWLAAHIEDVEPAELAKREEDFRRNHSKPLHS